MLCSPDGCAVCQPVSPYAAQCVTGSDLRRADEDGSRAELAAAGRKTCHCTVREQTQRQKTGTPKSGNVPKVDQQGPWAQICTSIAQVQCSDQPSQRATSFHSSRKEECQPCSSEEQCSVFSGLPLCSFRGVKLTHKAVIYLKCVIQSFDTQSRVPGPWG